MWQLIELKATNICAFEHLEYRPIQNQATLVFGNNLDNDSQNSNGSGKSALIEALAIGILGEPLRKVNADEIINDRFDEATVSMSLFNQTTKETLTVNRKLSRKAAQDIQITSTIEESTEEVKQASVADYNKYVLERIGLSKEDILHNFILTARKYQSFLSSSDKDKKEIINRFSNGVMVDESIEALHADMVPLQHSLQEAENNVAKCTGRVLALAEEIDRIVNEEAENKANVQKRIEEIQNSIASKRKIIRDNKQDIEELNSYLDKLDKLDVDMQSLEKSDADTTNALRTINKLFNAHNIPEMSNYFSDKVDSNHATCYKVTKEIEQLMEEYNSLTSEIAGLDDIAQAIEESNQKEFKAIDKQSSKLDEEIQSLRDEVRKLKEQNEAFVERRSVVCKSIADLEKQLAGVIECPKCHHEFTLNEDINIDEARAKLDTHKVTLENTEAALIDIDRKYNKCVNDGRAKSEERTGLSSKIQELQQTYNSAKLRLNETVNRQSLVNSRLNAANDTLHDIQASFANLRKSMFDEAFNAIDTAIRQSENDLDYNEKNIGMLQAAIEEYEKQIEQLENSSQENGLERIKESKARYEQDLKNAEANKETIAAELNTLKIQEATFVEFKTYLANAKINAISQITNDFLEAIGSDIRVNLSGYTVLKSGKVRDKISVSLIRDGIDCGSFDKFSAGEKCRVELASVLALHKLSNVNCEEGKGFNLLVIDEILDCTDEIGLANVFKALNDTQVTALVVSHGNIAENYPNRLVVTKQNGVSTINEKSN